MEPSRLTVIRRAFRSGSSEFWRGRLAGTAGFWRPVLIKRLTPELVADPRLAEQERSEALLTAHLVHPNILTVIEFGLFDGQPTTIHENVVAVDLLHLLERATAERRRLPGHLALHIVRQVLAALSAAHRHVEERLGFVGIAHGNLSPANILIDTRGHVLVRDFGIPLLPTPQGALARLGRLHGKPGYMSPELVTRGLLGPRSDLFAVGILLYELTSFRRLFAGKDGADTLKRIAVCQVEDRISRLQLEMGTPPYEAMVRALSRQPDDRFGSADDMLAALGPTTSDDDAELAAFVLSVAPPIDEEVHAADGSLVARPRSGRRAPAHLILPEASPQAGQTPTETALTTRPAVILEESDDWLDAAPPPLPPLPELEVLLAGIEPVGPPPLPGELGPPPLPYEAPTRSAPRPKRDPSQGG